MKRFFRKIKWFLLDLKNCRKNARAVCSARFILEETTPNKMSEITGLPEGVTAAAYDNIFYN